MKKTGEEQTGYSSPELQVRRGLMLKSKEVEHGLRCSQKLWSREQSGKAIKNSRHSAAKQKGKRKGHWQMQRQQVQSNSQIEKARLTGKGAAEATCNTNMQMANRQAVMGRQWRAGWQATPMGLLENSALPLEAPAVRGRALCTKKTLSQVPARLHVPVTRPMPACMLACLHA